ncbi:MAG: FAD-binding oxidoreductase [Spirochaetaceae bacterium]
MSHLRRIRAYLREQIKGTWTTEHKNTEAYAKDQSVFRLQPRVVVVPKDLEDLARVLALGREEGLPVTPRGGGSSTGGASVGSGIVVDTRGEQFSRIMVSEGPEGPVVTAGPGVRHDRVQSAFRERGYYLPSDPSSGPLSYLGGNIATKASGAHALRHGAIDRYLRRVEVMLPDGTLLGSADALPPEVTRSLDEAPVSKLSHPGLAKCASGYNLSGALRAGTPEGRLAGLVCGAVGTLGVVTQAVLSGEPVEPERSLAVLGFSGAPEATDAVGRLLALDPAAIELLDEGCIGLMPPEVFFAKPLKGAALVLELEGAASGERAREAVSQGEPAFSWVWDGNADAEIVREFWKGRKRMLFSVKQQAGGDGAPSLINDIGVPVPRLRGFVEDVGRLVAGYCPKLFVYGHAGSGNLHLRPDVRGVPPERQVAMARAVYELVLAYAGTVTGEHGMGRLRAPWLRREWGPEVYAIMKSIKEAVDPTGMMNPETMFTDCSFERMMEKASLG